MELNNPHATKEVDLMDEVAMVYAREEQRRHMQEIKRDRPTYEAIG